MKHVIKDIENTTKLIFEKKGYGIFKISGRYLTDAINNRKNLKEPIKVLKWFDDFWLYIEIRFIKVSNEYKDWKKDKRDEFVKMLTNQFIKFEEDFFQTSVTLSVFQGDDDDTKKTQLFRAEWDSFADNKIHPQPHWHVFPFKYDYKTTEDFETYMELYKEQDFEDFIRSENNKLADISKFHFAMNGQWTMNNGKTHIHLIESDESLTNWIAGVLSHIKDQLEYIK